MRGYYSNSNDLDIGLDIGFAIIKLFVCIAILVVFMIGVNSCSAEYWNNGICPDCNVRYELRGVSRGLHYYVCPECGREVDRY